MFGILKKTSAVNVPEFVGLFVDKLVKQYPPSMDTMRKRKISVKRLTAILEGLYKEVDKVKSTGKISLFKKAKISNEVKWKLKDKGYSEEFVSLVTEGLIVYLTRKNK